MLRSFMENKILDDVKYNLIITIHSIQSIWNMLIEARRDFNHTNSLVGAAMDW